MARLRPERAKFYPGIDRDTWWPAVTSDELGVRVDLGTREQFMFWIDVETREE